MSSTYYSRNRLKCIQKSKEYYHEHRGEYKEYNDKNKEIRNSRAKQHYIKNREKIIQRQKNKQLSPKSMEKRKLRFKLYYQNNKEKMLQQHKQWQSENMDKKIGYVLKQLKRIGGMSNLSSHQYKGALIAWSKTVQKNYNYTCQNCGKKSEVSHHLIYKSVEPNLSLNPTNGIALCVPCHKNTHGWNTSL